jgi:hypothetical protein
VEESHESSSHETLPTDSSVGFGELKGQVIELIRANRKIEAIKLVKDKRNLSLKEALVWVDEIHKEIDPSFVSFKETGGCASGVFKLVAIFFGIVGFLLLGSTLLVYWFQSEQIKRSDKIPGKVTSFIYSENTTAPVITYLWDGSTMTYQSNSFSYPPAYELNEEVNIYVDRNEPSQVLIDSFFDRWFLISLLGGVGLVFTFLTFAFVIASNKSKIKVVKAP